MGKASRDKGSDPTNREWRPCVGFPAYEVSEDGDVRRCVRGQTRPAGHILPGSINQGYRRYKLMLPNGGKQTVRAHCLVAQAFLGPAPSDRHEVAHNDGDRQHNHHSNLRWATRRENHADLQIHGTALKGVKNGRAKLTDNQVRKIRAAYQRIAWTPLHQYGEILKIRKKYGIGRTTLRDIVTNRRWQHVR